MQRSATYRHRSITGSRWFDGRKGPPLSGYERSTHTATRPWHWQS